MQNNDIMMKEKLGFFAILAQSVKLPLQNPKLVLATFLASLPLFCAILLHETIFQDTLIEIVHLSAPLSPYYYSCDSVICLTSNPRYDLINYIVAELPIKVLKMVLVYLGVIHLVDLINTGVIVNAASVIYSDGGKNLSVKEIFRRTNIKGPYITSLYSLLLASLSLLGLSSLGYHAYYPGSIYSTLFFGALFNVLLGKYMEWSAIWNTGIVISVLDDQKQGDIALGVSAYFSRGNRLCGAYLNAVFFVWKVGLRLMCLYVGVKSNGDGSSRLLAILVMAFLVCVSNVMKWVAFTVYFYDCKRRFLEKKVDVEAGPRKNDVK